MAKAATAAEQILHSRSVSAVANAALAAADLDAVAREHLLTRADELQIGLTELIERLATTSEYQDEEVRSPYTYPAGFGLHSMHEQVDRLREIFPQLAGCKFPVTKKELPHGADGYAAIPRWQCIAHHHHDAVRIMMEKLEEAFGTEFTAKDRLSKDRRLHTLPRTVEGLRHAAIAQPHCDFLTLPVQFGMRHRGCSDRRAIARLRPHEFPLGIFEGGALLLTHPERLTTNTDLWASFGGDVYRNPALSGHKGPGSTAAFHIEAKKVECDTFWHDKANPFNGPVTAWVN